jgi:hypothetical protein
MVFLLFVAPSTGAFIENSPVRGAAGMPRVSRGAGALLLTLDKSEEHRK